MKLQAGLEPKILGKHPLNLGFARQQALKLDELLVGERVVAGGVD